MTTALVTGGNRGIGLELCRQLAERGQTVVAVCRRGSSELDALSASQEGRLRVETGVDVTDDGSIRALAERLGSERLGLLVHNAGLLTPGDALGEIDFDAALEQFRVNALGPLRLTSALLANLGRGSKLAIITSRMGSIADNTSGGRYGYRMSKAAVNMAGMSLTQDLRPRGVAVTILHPGFVRTGMTGGRGDVEADVAARGLIARIDELTLESSGGFWHANGQRLPW
ncbi:MAG: SDR family oxidoreductase [Deltaproteobacteria bacterium]|jgi:NAD(P)-dependent dehydrogenase (short-subunit alcohol dehydrogenase family)|nr:SDR family oxidoreductase [Deltaproteobacteria bacterium]MBW2536027.1 SDR family oxidoreductase [Deltaproteobacteria bacterium]